MKNKVLLLIAGCCAWLLSSCLNSDDEVVAPYYPNCQIASFSLSSDSLSILSSVKFTIDQLNGQIFNADSLPYGTELKDKVTGTISYVNSSVVNGMEVLQLATGDTVLWNGSDSLDFSQPIIFKVNAYDGMTNKVYRAWINIHQVQPDSMVWSMDGSLPVTAAVKSQKTLLRKQSESTYIYMYVQTASAGYQLFRSPAGALAWSEVGLTGLPASGLLLKQLAELEGRLYVAAETGELYSSSDGATWQQVAEAPQVKALYGVVGSGDKQTPALLAVVETAEGLQFASMTARQVWTMGEAVPADFPVSGFATANYFAMHFEYLLAAGGRSANQTLLNSVWGTRDGLNWALYTPEGYDPFSAREDVMLTPYDDRLFLIGGLDANGKGLKDMYVSTDHGITWAAPDSMILLPESFLGRGAASVLVDSDQFLYIVGGSSSKQGNELNEVWRGRINRLGFKN